MSNSSSVSFSITDRIPRCLACVSALALAVVSAVPLRAAQAAPRHFTAEYHYKLDQPPLNGAAGGNAALLVNPSGPSVMFDVGDLFFGASLPDRLDALGIGRVVVVISHCHTDHSGGILPLLVSRPELVKVILYPQGEDFPACLLEPLIRIGLLVEGYQRALGANAAKFKPFSPASRRPARKILGPDIEVFQPAYDSSHVPKVSNNDRSLNLCVHWPNSQTSLLFGDTNVQAMDSLLADAGFARCLREADILLVNHHGRAEENNGELLGRMAAMRENQALWLAVISAQTPNGRTFTVARSLKNILLVGRVAWTSRGTLRIECGNPAAECKVTQPGGSTAEAGTAEGAG